MTPLAFLRGAEAQALIARAARMAGVPLSVHYVDAAGEEGVRVIGHGGCAACRHVAAQPGGRGACRASRQTASVHALRQGRPIPFVCHMGFGCVSTPALAGEGFAVTLGPYAPIQEVDTIERDALAGLAALGGAAPEAFPVPLLDIRRAPPGTAPAVAAWLTESLGPAFAAALAPAGEPPPDAPPPPPLLTRRRRPARAAALPGYGAAEIAAALAAGDQPRAREVLAAQLAEGRQRGRAAAAVLRARTAAVVAAALEAAERAKLPTAEAWAAFDGLAAGLARAADEAACLDAAMGVLGIVRRRAQPRQAPRTAYAALDALLEGRLAEPITLAWAAAELGETPSAISKRLIRKFGMNFSEYVGRLRMHQAKALLRRTEIDAGAVGRRVGIGDQSNFGKLFRKYEGMTPLEYRRRHGKKP